MIRPVRKEDIPSILEIYRPYITDTTITFEYDVPSLEEFTQRTLGICAEYPYIVWVEDDVILGYAYASRAFGRVAYAWDADFSIYLKCDSRGRGIGRKLTAAIEELLRMSGFHNLYSIITGENDTSIAFHKALGYNKIAFFPQCGFKFGRWLDVYWYAKRLCEADAPKDLPTPFEWNEKAMDILMRCAVDGDSDTRYNGDKKWDASRKQEVNI